jgi:hypothetical protein
MFYVGLIVGIFIGAWLGIIIISLLTIAKLDYREQRMRLIKGGNNG